jgi:hypothetical protein
MHAVIGDAELAIIALDMALTIAVGLNGRFRVPVPVPPLTREKQPFVAELRDHYSHVDERALGLIMGKPNARAKLAFEFDPLIDAREFSDGERALGVDAEATDLMVATRDYFVRVWLELVGEAVKRGNAAAGVNWAAANLTGDDRAASLRVSDTDE